MNRGPVINALAAIVYILLIVAIIFGISSTDIESRLEIFMTIIVLSLLVLSVATMGFIFFYHPFQLFFNNKRAEAVKYFLETLAIFGIIVFAFTSILLLVA